MPFNLGMGEIFLVLLIALLVFGGRLPEVGRSLGRGILEFKEGLKGKAAPPDDGEKDEEPERIGHATPHGKNGNGDPGGP
jgi:sec-independent protein translocase protein TatA